MMSDVLCPIADSLFEKFAEATHEHFEATDNLSMLTNYCCGLKNFRQKFDHAPSKMIFLQLNFPLNGAV